MHHLLILCSIIFISCTTLNTENQPAGSENHTVIEEGVYRPEAKRKDLPKQKPAVAALLSKAKTDLATGQLELAQSYVERAYRIDYKDGHVHFMMAKILLAKDQPKEAEQWALRAIDLYLPEDILPLRKAWEFVSRCRLKRGDYDGANKAIERAKKIEYRQ